MNELIASIDIGKTNAKLSFIDAVTGTETWSVKRASRSIDTPAIRQLDVQSIERWLLDALKRAPNVERVTAIVPIAHGATAVLVDKDGAVLAAPDYEDPRFEGINAGYERERDPFEVTYSPSLPLGLNLGRQLFYLQTTQPQLFARTAHILPYPQYWGWRLSGVMAGEVTSLGCHSDLWRPAEKTYSALAKTRGWSSLFPEPQFAGATLGTVTPQVAGSRGLDPACRVVCGIHDSNASYLQYLIDTPETEPFTAISSGTWTVVMANHVDLTRLRADRDMLANVDAFGSPVATARFMGGREYETIARSATPADIDSLERVVQQQAFALPAFAPAGPFSGCKGSAAGVDRMNDTERAALATLYLALMSDLLIELLDAKGALLIDGPLASNIVFARLLATFRPDRTVRVNSGTGSGCHRAAAYLAGFGSIRASSAPFVAPLDMPGLHSYRMAWRQRLPR